MSQQPPEPTAVPTAPAGVPYAVISRPQTSPVPGPSGLTSDGNVVRVRPWRGSNAGIARAAQGLLVLMALGNVALALLEARVERLLAERDLAEAVRLVQNAGDLTWLRSRIGVLTAVVFLVWLHRMWTSDRSAHNVYTRGTGLAVGGWLVPVANLVLAPNALRDLWHGTERARDGVLDGPVDRSTPRLVSVWWLAWCLMCVGAIADWFVQRGVDLTSSDEDVVSILRAGLRLEIFTSAASAVSGVLLVLVIGRITTFTRR